jgi:hypothetical protein
MFHNLQKENVMREIAKQQEELVTQSQVMLPFAHPGMIAGYMPYQMMPQHMAPMHTEKIEYEMEYTPPQIIQTGQTTTQK